MEEPSLIITSKRNLHSTLSSDLEVVCKSLSKLLLEKPSLSMLMPQTQLKTSNPKSKTKRESLLINKDLFSLENNLKTEEPFLTTTSKRNPHSTLSSDSEVECKSLSRPSLVKPSLLMLMPQTQLKTSNLRFRTKKESLQINKDLFSQENNSKTEELSQTITSKKSQHSTLSSDLEVVCKSSSKPSLEKQLLLTLTLLTPLKTSKAKFKTKRESLLTNKDSSLLVNNLKTEELSLTTTSKKNPHSTLSSDSEVECKSLSRLSLERPLLSTLMLLIPSKMLNPKFKIKKESHQTNKD